MNDCKNINQITEHFTLEELTKSQTAVRIGIDNIPENKHLENLKNTAIQMEKIRELLGCPINVSSGYRSPELNSVIRGSAKSAHCEGKAIDFTAPEFGSPKEVCKAIIQSKIIFDQLIYEGTWVHIAFDSSPRRSILTAHFGAGGTTYSRDIA